MNSDTERQWHSLDVVRERLDVLLGNAQSSIVWIGDALRWEIVNSWGQRLLLLVIDDDAVTMAIPPCGGVDWEPAQMPDKFLGVVADFLSHEVAFELDPGKGEAKAILRSDNGRPTVLCGDYWPDE